MIDEIEVLRQRKWTDADLLAADFKRYEPIKRLVMARILPEITSIQVTLETLVARKGDIICYAPGDHVRSSLDAYEHWPVRRDLFRKTYDEWDDPQWQPTPPESDLMRYGCRPFHRSIGIWAKRLRKGIWVQSLESLEPVFIPPGRWLCIGTEGEPYNMNNKNFRARYDVPLETWSEKVVWSLISSLANMRYPPEQNIS